MTRALESPAPIGTVAAARRRLVWVKESAALIGLAVAGIALEFPLIKSISGNGPLHIYRGTWLLVGLVPIAVWLVPKLGLPGSPWLSARLRGEVSNRRLSSYLKPAVLYALLGMAAERVAGIVEHALQFSGTSGPSKLSRGFSPPAVRKMPGQLAMGAIGASAGTAIYEEVAYRLVVLTLGAWAVSRVWRDREGRPRRGAFWCANLLQAYVFGLVHLNRGFAVPYRWNVPIPIVALALPQTWIGIVLGALYLRHGLEASMLSHLIMDAALFLLIIVASLLGLR